MYSSTSTVYLEAHFFFYLTFSDKLQLLPGKLQTRIPSLPMNITKDQFQPTEEDPN